MKYLSKLLVAAALALSASACSTWDSMSSSEKGTLIGAGTGAAVGGMATDSTLGTVGGAAAGGLIGHEVGKRRD